MLKNTLDDTIAAISTPIGQGGIGIIRLSGKDALAVADKVFMAKAGKRPSSYKTYTVHYGWIVNSPQKKKNQLSTIDYQLSTKIIDEVLLTVMRAPRSYTKEDIVEISCHSGIVVLREILDLVLAAGAALTAGLALLLDPAFIRWLLLGALPLVAFAVLTRHEFGGKDRSAELGARTLRDRACLVSASVGAYDGFFGPGTGTFFAIAFARWGRHDLLGATARAKILNLVSNLGALGAFIWAGRLDWKVGLSMSLLSVAGHWVGAHLGVKKGAAVIRPVVAFVCAGLFAKVLFDALR